MKALDWQRFLQEQRDRHHKVVFTTAELANVAQSGPGSLNVALRRLVGQGALARYSTGRYGLPGVVGPEDLVPTLDTSAYITGMYALYRYRLITQRPVEITCFARRRHNLSRVRQTPIGRLVFVCVTSSVYSMPQGGVIASPEQACCDHVYLCRKRGVPAFGLASFRNLDQINRETLAEMMPRYPATVRREVAQLLAGHG